LALFRRADSASTLDLLVVGLGNPGRRYARDRHNVGFMVVDELARRWGAAFRQKFSGQTGEVRVGQAKVALLKPDTFMNDSGRSVQSAVAFYKTPLDTLLVIHDEVDLEHGRLQVRLGGGLAGHNGLRSLAGRLGSPDFLRLRVGVGRPGKGDPRDVADFVLAPFAPEDDAAAVVGRAADAVESLLDRGLEETQQSFNERPPAAPSPG
jgi:peptidyl-tRNA hydrolase, PTH1 family